MYPTIRRFFCIIGFALSLTGCTEPPPNPTVHSLIEIPAEIRAAINDSMNPIADMKPEQFKPEFRQTIRDRIAQSKKTYRVLDSNEAWSPGCGNGARFIEARESSGEWVARCEQGGYSGRVVYEIHISKTEKVDGVLRHTMSRVDRP